MSTKTVLYAENKHLHAKQIPIGEPKPNEVIVKIEAIGLNPTDWKHLDWQISDGTVLGCDFAGEIYKVGSEVTDKKIGDKVIGMTGGGNLDEPDTGAFSEYVNIDHNAAIKVDITETAVPKVGDRIPEGKINSLAAAASISVGLATTVFALLGTDGIPVVANSQSGFAVVYGGSSSLGFMASQVLKYIGFDVIVVVSKKHTALFDSIGFSHDRLVDYRDSDWVEQVKKIGGDDIVYAYDTISSGETFGSVMETVSRSKPVHFNASMPLPQDLSIPENVTATAPFAYHISQAVKSFGPVKLYQTKQQKDNYLNYFEAFARLLPLVKHLPVRIAGEGFDAIEPSLDLIRSGKNSGEKIVILL